jgi:nitroreductase
MNEILDLISRRRAVKLFEPVEISRELRQQILNAARHAPSSSNLQPCRFYWVQSEVKKAAVAKLCLRQKPAETASALIVAVADLKSLSVTSQDQLEWMRTSNFTEENIRDYERKAKIGRIIVQAWAIRNICCDQMGPLSAIESADGDRTAAAVPAGLVQMGDKEHVAGVSKSDDCC